MTSEQPATGPARRWPRATLLAAVAAALLALVAVACNSLRHTSQPRPYPTPSPPTYAEQHRRVTERGQTIAALLGGELIRPASVADYPTCTTSKDYGGGNGYQVIGFWYLTLPGVVRDARLADVRNALAARNYRISASPPPHELLIAHDWAADLDLRIVADSYTDVVQVAVTGQCYPWEMLNASTPPTTGAGTGTKT